MVSSSTTNISDRILSSVVPANVTGDLLHELTGIDLALKLHYLRTVYYFKHSEIVENLGIVQLKEPMFLMLDVFPEAAGRIRRHESGKPHIKCNDSGVRIVEAKCKVTMDEYLKMESETDRCKNVVYDKVIGPDLFFSPLVYIQFTKFKCGGLSIGMHWSHLIGDATSSFNFINLWTNILNTKKPVPKPENQYTKLTTTLTTTTDTLYSIKKIESVGDFWLKPSTVQMSSFSFQINEPKLKNLLSKISNNASPFEAISALAWHAISSIREGKGTSLVTVIKNESSQERKLCLKNGMSISTVTTDSLISKLELSELAMLVKNVKGDDKIDIDDMVEKENGKDDYVVYGANLTFVDMEGVGFYGLDVKGQKPAHVDCVVHGAGEGGAVLVIKGNDEAREVTVILPVEEVLKVKQELEKEWGF